MNTAKLAGNVGEYTVTELSSKVKKTLEETYGYVRVRGELGRVSRPGSGHVYLDLKDEKSVIAGVIWKGVASGLSMQPEQGLEVIATGRITTYPGQSKYQLIIDALEPAGIGALMALLEKRKKQFAEEGLFDEERKKQLPYIPKCIGVITSPTGAVIRDILHRLSDRFPRDVIVWPVRVQGEQSAKEVASAILGFNALEEGGSIPKPDLLIVARGGGALEELWGYNEEIVVRAAAASEIPLISAVGHETDWTLIDLVADMRAPTPTAAAEIAVPVKSDLLATLDDLNIRAKKALNRTLNTAKGDLRSTSRGLPRVHDILQRATQRLDLVSLKQGRGLSTFVNAKRGVFDKLDSRFSQRLLTERLRRASDGLLNLQNNMKNSLHWIVKTKSSLLLKHDNKNQIIALKRRAEDSQRQLKLLAERANRASLRLQENRRNQLNGMVKLLNSLSYNNVLKRGFALVHTVDGKLIRSSSEMRDKHEAILEFADGKVTISASTTAHPPPAKSRSSSSAKKVSRKDDENQGSLF